MRRQATGRVQRVEVIVELGDPLDAWLPLATHPAARDRIARSVSQVSQDLGWPVQADVQVRRSDTPRAVRVRIAGRLRPYPPEVLRRAWSAVRPVAHEAQLALWRSGYPDAWLAAVARSDGSVEHTHVARFLAFVAREVVQRHPSSLIDAVDVRRYLAGSAGARSLLADPLDDAVEVLRDVMEQGISLGPRGVPEMLSWAKGLSLPPAHTAEAVIDRLSLGRIEVQGHPDTLGGLGLSGSPAAVEKLFAPVRTLLLQDLGLRLPPIVAVSRSDLPDGRVAVRVNDLFGTMLPVVPTGHMLLVVDAQSTGAERVVDGRPAFDPVFWRPAVVLPAGRAANAGLEAISWTPQSCVALLLYGELLRQLGRLLWLGVVEEDLLRMCDAAYPALVRLALGSHSAAGITRLLRSLLEEYVPIRDLRAILETLVRHRAAPGPGDAHTEVRLALGGQLTYRALGDAVRGQVPHLDPALEGWAAASFGQLSQRDGDPPEQEAMAERVRDAAWEAFRGDAWRKVILAADASRDAVRTVLGSEMPGLTVLADAEVADHLDGGEIEAHAITLPRGSQAC